MATSSNKIALILPYFGKWPDWVNLLFESIRRNDTIDFLIYTDCDYSKFQNPNIKFTSISFEDYCGLIREKLQVSFSPSGPYKLCDMKPFYGFIHEKEISTYDFYGYFDSDLIFGDIRSFYSDNLLDQFDLISTHEVRISGHFALFRNNKENRTKFLKIYNWEEEVAKPDFVGIDEHGLTNAYLLTFLDRVNEKFGWNINNYFTRLLAKRKRNRLYFKEECTTPFTVIPWFDGTVQADQPSHWEYKDGVITNERDDRNFVYLHFMNFKSSKYRFDGRKGPWEGKEFVFAGATDMKRGITISENGIFPIT